MIVKKYTEEYRKQLLDLYKGSLFSLCMHGFGMADLGDIHWRLCEGLQGRGEFGKEWLRLLVVMARGLYKSSIVDVGYSMHCGLFPETLGLQDHSTRLLGASYTNIQANSVQKIRNLFLEGDRSGELQWVFRHRLPENFAGWTEDTVTLQMHNPLSFPAVTCKGMTAKQESYHGNLLILDDAEGADAEKGTVGNEDARRVVANIAPLLIRPDRDRVIVVGTPWGADPLVFRLLREDLNDKVPDRSKPWEPDNDKRVWKQFYVPILNSDGKSVFPEVFTENTLRVLRSGDRRMWNSQYLLLEGEDGESIFGNENIERTYYEFLANGKGVKYPALKLDVKKWKTDREYEDQIEHRECLYDEMRFFLHADLIHREDTISHKHTGTARPSRAAICIVGVAPDGHAFLLETWNWPGPGEKLPQGELAINLQVRQAYRLHMKYGCTKASWDSIGAQVWFKAFCQQLERTNQGFRGLKSSGKFGPQRAIPSLSSILVEDQRSPRMHKEDVIFERLAPWIQDCRLHFHAFQDTMIGQLKNLETTDYIDLADALAQGPELWRGPMPKKVFARYRLAEEQRRSLRSELTGYYSPWRDKVSKVPRLEDPSGDFFDARTRIN